MSFLSRFRLRSVPAAQEQFARQQDEQAPFQSAPAAPQPEPFDEAAFRREWSALPDDWFPMRNRTLVQPPSVRDPMLQAIHQIQPNRANRDSVDVKREAFRAARKAQTVPIAVAPYTSLHVARNGKALTLHAGEEILPSDFIGDQTVQARLWKLVGADAVIALSEDEVARSNVSSTARYLVADGGSVATKRGIVDEGLVVTAEDFKDGQAALDDLVRRGAIIDRQPSPPPKAA